MGSRLESVRMNTRRLGKHSSARVFCTVQARTHTGIRLGSSTRSKHTRCQVSDKECMHTGACPTAQVQCRLRISRCSGSHI